MGVNLNTVARAYAARWPAEYPGDRAGGGTVVARGRARRRSRWPRSGQPGAGRAAPGSARQCDPGSAGGRVRRRRDRGRPSAPNSGSLAAARRRSPRPGPHRWGRAGSSRPSTCCASSRHDLALEVLSRAAARPARAVTLEVVPTDSLDGLFALARGPPIWPGAHLPIPRRQYNVPFVRRLLPGRGRAAGDAGASPAGPHRRTAKRIGASRIFARGRHDRQAAPGQRYPRCSSTTPSRGPTSIRRRCPATARRRHLAVAGAVASAPPTPG